MSAQTLRDGRQYQVGRSIAVLALAIWASVVSSQAVEAQSRNAEEAIAPSDALALLFEQPSELTLGAPQGDPPIHPVLKEGAPFAWFASSYALTRMVGYSGRPIDILVAVGPDARILGAVLARHNEPILTLGIDSRDLERHVAGYRGIDVRERLTTLVRNEQVPDAVSGATISSSVIRQAILRTGRIVAQRAGLLGGATGGVATDSSWPELLAGGQVGQIAVSYAQARAALPGVPNLPEGEGNYAEVFFAPASDPAIGQALLGEGTFNELSTELAVGDNLLIVAGSGLYSFKGTQWRRSGVFERLALSQAGAAIPLLKENHVRLEGLDAENAPGFRQASAFRLPAESGFDPAKPFSLTLVVEKSDEAGEPVVARFEASLASAAAAAGEPASQLFEDEDALWQLNWENRAPELAFLTLMLVALFGILYVSGPIVRRRSLYEAVRLGFLALTLVWLGWMAGAQLSIVQIVSFLQALLTSFQWETFLLDPLIFVLWSFVALGVLFWGRGVFCGWLCPFGALQELSNWAARRLGVKQIAIPWEIHERLWPIKYAALLLIVAVSLHDLNLAFKIAEVEPFKTAIALHFIREWPYVAFALVLLGIGLFVERAYCRYLCPLGAALTLPSKLKIFDWLIRRPQCGRECHICERTCTVQAIDPVGRINPNECIYCLRCQANYYDANTCLPLKMRRARRQGAKSGAKAGPEAKGAAAS